MDYYKGKGTLMQSTLFEGDSQLADIGLAWGVKESFVKYIQGARDGQIIASAGAGMTDSNELYYPISRITRANSEIYISFNGAVRFLAHFGMLSVTLATPRIILRADTAELAVADEDEGWIHVLHLELPAPESDEQVHMWRDIGTSLVESGLELFGNVYNAGEQMAPATLRLPNLDLLAQHTTA